MRTSIFRIFEHEPTIGWQWIYRPSMVQWKLVRHVEPSHEELGFHSDLTINYTLLHHGGTKTGLPQLPFGSSFKRYLKKKRKSHNPSSFHQQKFQQKIIKSCRYQRTRTNPSQLRIRSARMAPLQCAEPRVSKVSTFWGSRRFHRSFTDFFHFPQLVDPMKPGFSYRCFPFTTGVFTVGFIHLTDSYDPFQQRDIQQKESWENSARMTPDEFPKQFERNCTLNCTRW